jgi:hypothetical protein
VGVKKLWQPCLPKIYCGGPAAGLAGFFLGEDKSR